MDHMPKVFGVFMLGLFFLRSTGILRSQKNEEIRKTEVVILKKNKIWKLPDNIRSTVSMSTFFVVTDYSFHFDYCWNYSIRILEFHVF